MKTNNYLFQQGFTLMELMIGIGMLAILMSIAVPSYQNYVKNSCLTTTSITMVGSFQFARAEAVKRRRNINVVATGGDWNAGWTIQDSSDNSVIKTFSLESCPLTVISKTGGNSATILVYELTGFADAATVFTVCDDRVNKTVATAGRQISIAPTGRPKTDSKFIGGGGQCD